MSNAKSARIDKDFEKTVRMMFPFAKSLSHSLRILNTKLQDELYGVKDDKKKR